MYGLVSVFNDSEFSNYFRHSQIEVYKSNSNFTDISDKILTYEKFRSFKALSRTLSTIP